MQCFRLLLSASDPKIMFIVPISLGNLNQLIDDRPIVKLYNCLSVLVLLVLGNHINPEGIRLHKT